MEKTLKTQNPHKRTLFGRIIKYSFIGFNIIYFIWAIYLIVQFLIRIQNPISQGTIESASIGIAFSIVFIIFTWLFGNFVLGVLLLLTRPKK